MTSQIASHVRHGPKRGIVGVVPAIADPYLPVAPRGFGPKTLGMVVAFPMTQSRAVQTRSGSARPLAARHGRPSGAEVKHAPDRADCSYGPARIGIIAGPPLLPGLIRHGAVRAQDGAGSFRSPVEIASDLDPERVTGFLAAQVARKQPTLHIAGATMDRGDGQCVFAYSLLYPGPTIAAAQHVASS